MEKGSTRTMNRLTRKQEEVTKEKRKRNRRQNTKRADRIYASQDCIPRTGKRFFKITPGTKYQELHKSERWKIVAGFSSGHSLEILCDIARVSLSGYYAWRKRVKDVCTKEDREREDMEKIRSYVLKYHKKHGYRIITMKLQKDSENMNHKKVYRLMKKYHLLSIIRRKNPYRFIQKATQEHRTAKNILNREFRTNIPYKKL